MAKPLLTDEIIENAKRNQALDSDDSYSQDTQIYLDMDDIVYEKGYTYKSRRIENAKRNAFQSKLNKILLIVIVLLALLIFAIFTW